MWVRDKYRRVKIIIRDKNRNRIVRLRKIFARVRTLLKFVLNIREGRGEIRDSALIAGYDLKGWLGRNVER